MDYKDFEVGKEYLCIEDFYMDTGEILFVKGKKYKTTDMDDVYVTFDHYHSMSGDNLSIFMEPEKKELKIKLGTTEYTKALKDFEKSMRKYFEEVLAEGIYPSLIEESEPKSWWFRDTEINWQHLCMDLWEAGTLVAMVEGEDCCYFCGLWNERFNWWKELEDSGIPMEETMGLASYNILKVPKEKATKLKHFCKKYSVRFWRWADNLEEDILDRARDKTGAKKYTVTTF